MWKLIFLNHLDAIDADAFTPRRKRALLIGMLGQEGQRIVSTFNLAGAAVSAELTEFDVLLQSLDRHFGFTTNVVLERKKFLTRVQAPGESVLEFLGALRHLGSFCNFGATLEDRIAEIFLAGLRSSEVQDRLIREAAGAQPPSLERAVLLAQQFEQSSRDCDQYRQLSTNLNSQVQSCVERVFAPRTQNNAARPSPSSGRVQDGERQQFVASSSRAEGFNLSPRHQPRPSACVCERRPARDAPPGARAFRYGAPLCDFCGRQPHPRDRCPASGATCFSCGKAGHFANVCRSRPPPSACDRRQLAFPAGRGRGSGRRLPPNGGNRARAPIHGIVTFPEEDEDEEILSTVYTVRPARSPSQHDRHRSLNFVVDVEVNNFPMSLLIDTGSEVSILSEATFSRLTTSKELQLRKPPRTLVHYLRGQIPVLGCFYGLVKFQDRSATILFYVVRDGRSLLGTDAVRDLKLILSGASLTCRIVHTGGSRSTIPGHVTPAGVSQPTSPSPSGSSDESQRPSKVSSDPLNMPSPLNRFSSIPHEPSVPGVSPPRTPSTATSRDVSKLPAGFEHFEDLFSPGLGLVKNQTHTITVRRNVPPVQAKLRRLPITLRDVVTAEILKLEQQGVIERVSASEWVSPIVVVKKKEGGIRMCVDLRAPNKAIVVDSFPLPHIDELLNSLSGASHFSKLDLASAYYQVRLDPKSRDLTAFITHEGLFRFTRVCFGLASAPAAFQKIMSNILKDCKGVQFYLDDVIVYGSSQQEHDENLHTVLQKISQAGMKLNKKAVFSVQELTFLGHRLSAGGLAPLPSKIDVVLNFPAPCDPSQLKAFLGLVEYYSKFIQHCATIVEPLRRLLRKGVTFVWSSEADTSFQQIKACIQQAPILTMFDPCLPVVVSTDASNYGLGAVLQQQHGSQLRTVAFASRSLTEAERKYSTGEKEALAILWACEKWHIYLWGRQFTIRTDHQALVTLMSTQGAGVRPLRISRWVARLFNYNFVMEYRKGTDNVVADALSRLPVHDTEDGTTFREEIVSIVCASLTEKDFQEATSRDPALREVMKYTSSSWPEEGKLSPELRSYFVLRDQLSVVDGLLFQGEKIIVPPSLRDKVIQIGHETHQGISRTTSFIKELYWWPHIAENIKNVIQHCTVCHSTDKPAKASPAPLQPVAFPSRSWTKLAIDIVGPFEQAPPKERYFITLVDYHSKWPEVASSHNVTTASVVDFLKSIFSREGLPLEITTDNGPQFTSHEFNQFLQTNGIKHVKSSLYHPQGNGQVERFNRVLKSVIQLAMVQRRPLREAITEYLGVYRSTRHAATGETPAFLLHARNHRTRLHIQGRATPDPPLPRHIVQRDLPERVQAYQAKMKKYSDSRRAVKVPSFKTGQYVKVHKPRHHGKFQHKYSEPQMISAKIGPSTYTLDDGTTWNADKFTRTPLKPTYSHRSHRSSWAADEALFPCAPLQPIPAVPPVSFSRIPPPPGVFGTEPPSVIGREASASAPPPPGLHSVESERSSPRPSHLDQSSPAKSSPEVSGTTEYSEASTSARSASPTPDHDNIEQEQPSFIPLGGLMNDYPASRPPARPQRPKQRPAWLDDYVCDYVCAE